MTENKEYKVFGVVYEPNSTTIDLILYLEISDLEGFGGFKATKEVVAKSINQGSKYFVEHGRNKLYLKPIDRNGKYYLRTDANDIEEDNLVNVSSYDKHDENVRTCVRIGD